MRRAGNLLGNQVVWLCAVIGAGQGLAWPGVVAAALYCLSQFWLNSTRRVDLRLVLAALALGLALDSAMAASGLARYAAPWPSSELAPAWILGLWAAFAMTLTQSLAFLQQRAWLAFVFGAIGGPLAYLGAARGWQAVTFAPPQWQGWLALAAGWGVAMLVLARLARHWSGIIPRGFAAPSVATP